MRKLKREARDLLILGVVCGVVGIATPSRTLTWVLLFCAATFLYHGFQLHKRYNLMLRIHLLKMEQQVRDRLEKYASKPLGEIPEHEPEVPAGKTTFTPDELKQYFGEDAEVSLGKHKVGTVSDLNGGK